MLQLLIQLRSMNILYHQYHNIVGRVPFFQDHDAFGEFYSAVESDYDDVAERMIGLSSTQSLNLPQILAEVHKKCVPLSAESPENGKYFEIGLKLEQELCQMVESLCKSPGVSQGTIQLLGDIANASEKRIYKIKRRIAKG